ncbi:hypothetical protein AGATL06_18040 [Agathobaculum sp. TL06]
MAGGFFGAPPACSGKDKLGDVMQAAGMDDLSRQPRLYSGKRERRRVRGVSPFHAKHSGTGLPAVTVSKPSLKS